MARLSKLKQKLYKAQYQRERRRINSYIKRKESQGYEVGYNQIEKVPSYVTKKDVDRLKNITKQKLLNKTSYYKTDTNTGEVEKFTGKRAELVKRRESRKLKNREETFEEKLERMKRHAEGNESMYKFERDPDAPKRDVDEETGEVTVEGDTEPYEYEDDFGSDFEWETLTRTVAKSERTDPYVIGNPVDDFMLMGEAIEDLISNFYPSASFDDRSAYIVEQNNMSLMQDLRNAIAQLGRVAVFKNIAANYTELTSIVDHVQNYVNVAGEITRFRNILLGHPMTLAENMAYTETYNDSDTLMPYEIEDYET